MDSQATFRAPRGGQGLDQKELTAMPRWFSRNDNWDFGGRPDPTEDREGEPKKRKRRLATTFVFTVVFFAGASLAAVAGNKFSASISEDDATAIESTTASDGSEAAPAAEETAPAADDSAAAAPDESTAAAAATAAASSRDLSAPADAAATPDVTAEADAAAAAASKGFTEVSDSSTSQSEAAAPGSSASHRPKQTAAKRARARTEHLRAVLLPKTKPAPKPEIEGPADAATIWLNSPLPDPTPPALRLSSQFATNLKAAAQRNGVDWAVMLGILRARGATGHMPADRVTLGRLAARLDSVGPAKGDWARIVAYSGDTRFADRAAALARYDRAVGLEALVKGLEASKASIATRVLSDPMVSIYGGGRNDIVADKIDVRVLAMIAYLRESFGQVTVSCLFSGHRMYARPGVVSAHIYGRAVDIAGVGGVSIQGHQEPGGITERTVREILMLPAEVMPRQVISLLGLGGPSFPLADHYNHIHIGF
jgi:hypothetical protein